MIINENGFIADDFNTIFDGIADQLKAIYGQDINLEQNTQDGQYVGIDAKMISDLQNLALYIYNSFDPDFAQGVQLDRLLKLLARTRIPAKKSSLDINITTTESITLESDYTVQDEFGQNWIIASSQTLPIGTTLVTFLSEDYGEISLEANSTFEQVTIIPQITNLDNPNPATIGRNEESDQELKQRRNNILEINAYSTIGGILGKILDLDGVDDCIVYENATDTYDATRDINAHSYWVIAKGGDVAEITELIAKYKTGGTGLKGTIETTYTENFIRNNGTTRTIVHEVKFDRPSQTEIYINLEVSKKNPTDTIDIQAIKDSLVALDFNIAQNLTVTELYATVYSAGSNFIANSLELSKDNITYTDSFLQADYDEEFVITDAKINITEV